MLCRPGLMAIRVVTTGIAVITASGIRTEAGEGEVRRTLHSQASFVVSTPQVEVAVTETGGHMAPVVFLRNSDKPVRPYYVSPWQDEPSTPMPAPVLVPLRGDFFCMPFGGNTAEYHGEKHPPHGEIVGSAWTHVSTRTTGDVTTLTMAIETKVRPGQVTKELSLVNGHNVIYSRHVIQGFAGPAPLGHHATLAMPEQEGRVRISTSPIRFGMTYPGLFSDPQAKEYQALLPGTKWTELSRVPMAWKGLTDVDLSRQPSRPGYADLIQLFQQPASSAGEPAWVAATFSDDGYVWFSMKDPAVLNSTVFWMENRGRHGHPWNGRNNCLGLEDVTAYFADGLSVSAADNLLTNEGMATSIALRADKPTMVNYIQGVVRVPAEFDVVRTMEFGHGQVTLISAAGARVTTLVRHEFLKTGQL